MKVSSTVLTKCCYFGADQSLNMAVKGRDLVEHRTLWEIHKNKPFSGELLNGLKQNMA